MAAFDLVDAIEFRQKNSLKILRLVAIGYLFFRYSFDWVRAVEGTSTIISYDFLLLLAYTGVMLLLGRTIILAFLSLSYGGPTLAINPEGLYVLAGIGNLELLSWDNIAFADIERKRTTVWRHDFLTIRIKDSDRFYAAIEMRRGRLPLGLRVRSMFATTKQLRYLAGGFDGATGEEIAKQINAALAAYHREVTVEAA